MAQPCELVRGDGREGDDTLNYDLFPSDGVSGSAKNKLSCFLKAGYGRWPELICYGGQSRQADKKNRQARPSGKR